MASYNRVVLVGNLTRDPELRYISSGAAVTEIGLAVNDRRKNQSGEWVEETQFIDVTLWARTAEVASEYLSKGSPVLIEGRLKLDRWEKEGQKHSKLRVVGEKMQMLGSRSDGSGRTETASVAATSVAATSVAATSVAATSVTATSPVEEPVGPADPPEDDIPF